MRLLLWNRCSTIGVVGAIALLLSTSQLQAETYPGRGTAYVATPPGFNLNVRTGPGTQYTAVNTLRRGTSIAVTGTYDRGWAQLEDRNWVAGNFINSNPVSEYNPGYGEPGVARTAYIATPIGFNLNIRSGPGTQYPAVNTLARGTAITINGNYQNGWAQLTNGSWVAGNWIQIGQAIARPLPQPLPPPQATTLQLGSRSPAVLDLERRLLQLGYFTSNFVPDEYFGTDTQQAVRNFQQLNNLPIDGIAGPQTRTALASNSAIPNYAGGNLPNPPPVTDPPPTNPPPNQGAAREVRVSTNDGQDALAFSGPGTEYDLLGFVENGTTVTVTGRTQGNWSELNDGSWMYTEWLENL